MFVWKFKTIDDKYISYLLFQATDLWIAVKPQVIYQGDRERKKSSRNVSPLDSAVIGWPCNTNQPLTISRET